MAWYSLHVMLPILSSYSDALVKEVSLFFSRGILDSLRRSEVRGTRVGRPPYPNSLIILLALIHSYFSLPYRRMEGLAKMLSDMWSIPVPDYSTLNRRMRKLIAPVGFDASSTVYELTVDSTGYKVCRGDGMTEEYVRRGYVRVHIAVDVRSKQIVGLEVSDESIRGFKEPKPLVEQALEERAGVPV